MIAARLHKPDGGICIMLVLEPANIDKLKQGQPIHKFLSEFLPELKMNVELLFAYTPDAVWVSEQIAKHGSAHHLAEVLEKSLLRPEVHIRGKGAEDMKKV